MWCKPIKFSLQFNPDEIFLLSQGMRQRDLGTGLNESKHFKKKTLAAKNNRFLSKLLLTLRKLKRIVIIKLNDYLRSQIKKKCIRIG